MNDHAQGFTNGSSGYIISRRNGAISEADLEYMRLAMEEARKAFAEGEVPVGAVLVSGGEVIASDHNRKETCGDATAHAEMLVIREACRRLGNWRLTGGATIYVTLEPCSCVQALLFRPGWKGWFMVLPTPRRGGRCIAFTTWYRMSG